MSRRPGLSPDEAAARKRHYLALPTESMHGLRDDLIAGCGNQDLLAALQEELTRRIGSETGGNRAATP